MKGFNFVEKIGLCIGSISSNLCYIYLKNSNIGSKSGAQGSVERCGRVCVSVLAREGAVFLNG